MLKLIIHGEEYFDEETDEFIEDIQSVYYLEHSLLSISRWEAMYQVSFLGKTEKTSDEIYFYIQSMIIGEEVPLSTIHSFSNEALQKIHNYIESKQSATTFNDLQRPKTNRRSETITSELIYYWMVTFNIPFECETWNLNRLFNLIQICNIKNSKPKKMSRSEIASRNQALNAQRKAALQTRG